jgi:hypothetical protein
MVINKQENFYKMSFGPLTLAIRIAWFEQLPTMTSLNYIICQFPFLENDMICLFSLKKRHPDWCCTTDDPRGLYTVVQLMTHGDFVALYNP